MPDFAWVQSPVFSPTACATCSTHRDLKGFVDLLVDTPVNGRLYMCFTCTQRAGKEAAMVPKKHVIDLKYELTAANNMIAALEEQLEAARSDKVVSLADVVELLNQQPTPEAA